MKTDKLKLMIDDGVLTWNYELTFEPKDLLEGTIKDVRFLTVKC